MGFITNFLKIFGFWFSEKGTVFGGELGTGELGKIIFIAPYKPLVPEAPKIPPHEPEGHYPMRISDYLQHIGSYTDGYFESAKSYFTNPETNYRKLQPAY